MFASFLIYSPHFDVTLIPSFSLGIPTIWQWAFSLSTATLASSACEFFFFTLEVKNNISMLYLKII